MNLLHRSAVTLGVSCFFAIAATAAPAAAAPAAAPTKPGASTPAGKPGPSPAAPAITALVKEYQTSLKEKNGEGLREKCDYFSTGEKPEGLTPEVILAALEKPIPGAADPRAEAYVKWQLLSGLDGKFSDALLPRAIKAYRAAPVPRDHPARNHRALDQKLYRMGVFKADLEVGINKELTDAIAQYRLYVDPILDYRDEFYRRLPGGYDTLVAGVQDTFDRVQHGAPATEFWKTVSGEIRSWALTGGKPDQIKRLADASKQLYAEVKADRNKPYSRIMWVKEDKFEGLKWQSEQTIQYDKTIDELATWLEERASQPAGGGLQFKNPDDKMKK